MTSPNIDTKLRQAAGEMLKSKRVEACHERYKSRNCDGCKHRYKHLPDNREWPCIVADLLKLVTREQLMRVLLRCDCHQENEWAWFLYLAAQPNGSREQVEILLAALGKAVE